jgi:hypothetical protein
VKDRSGTRRLQIVRLAGVALLAGALAWWRNRMLAANAGRPPNK